MSRVFLTWAIIVVISLVLSLLQQQRAAIIVKVNLVLLVFPRSISIKGDNNIATVDYCDDQFGSQFFAATASNYCESQLDSLVFPRSTSVTGDSNIATTDYCSDQFGSQVCEVSAWIEINANTSFGWFVNGFLEEVEDYIHTETVLNSFTTFAIGRLQPALSTCFRAWQQHGFWQLMEQYSEAAQPREWCSLEPSVSSSEANACLRAFRLRHFTPYTCDHWRTKPFLAW